MKKSLPKWSPLQDRIDAFQQSPLGTLKLQQQGEEDKLRKVSRKRLLRRGPSLPYLSQGNKENMESRGAE
jgi:hypothetical protein